jgi:MYXO-CTERM domain-containing protein
VRCLRDIAPIACALTATLGLALAVPAGDAAAAGDEARAIAEARAWQGRWCPPAGCRGEPASFASVGGFAAATLGVLALARRRRS